METMNVLAAEEMLTAISATMAGSGTMKKEAFSSLMRDLRRRARTGREPAKAMPSKDVLASMGIGLVYE